MNFDFPFRQIHLDFHTSPHIPDVGADFNARAFARVMKESHVNSVTVFAKCHHGHLYYNTRHAARHPGLKKGLDLLRGQVDALHEQGIRAPIYISVQCDEFAANCHPEWVARNPDSSQVKATAAHEKVFGTGWQVLDMSTLYQDYLARQTEEILRQFKPVDGIFFDMCWDQPSTTQPFMNQMKRAGLNPESEAERQSYAHQLALAYMKRFYDMTKAHSKNATVYFNSRPLGNLAEEKRFLEQVEIEALPTGGWGYLYFPLNVRFARGFGKPYLGMTARFHKSWADFGGLKLYPALEYETSQMIAHGAGCSVGDQLHPRGILDRATYQLIGKAYERVASREPWIKGAVPVVEIGVLRGPPGNGGVLATNRSEEGVTRMLTQLKHQFDFIDAAADFSRFAVLILPDAVRVDAGMNKKLGQYLKNGGKILASGTSGLSADGKESQFKPLGVIPHGVSPFKAAYVRFAAQINAGVPPADHIIYDHSIRITAGPGSTVLARIVEPYFDRTWEHFSSHAQTPGDKLSRYAAAIQKGAVVYVAFPVFSAFGEHGNYPYRLLVKNILDRLLPEPLLRMAAPTSTETSIMRQKFGRSERTILHILQYPAERRTPTLDLIEDIVPLHNVPFSLKTRQTPQRVYLSPAEQPLDFKYINGRVEVTVPRIDGHAMVVFE